MKHNNLTRGGELPYASPSLDILDVSVEEGFVISNEWDTALDEYPDWNEGSNEFE